MPYSVEDTYTPEDGFSFDASELAHQLSEMFQTILASGGEPVTYVTVGPDRLHVGRISQIVEVLSDGDDVRSIHLELVDPVAA